MITLYSQVVNRVYAKVHGVSRRENKEEFIREEFHAEVQKRKERKGKIREKNFITEFHGVVYLFEKSVLFSNSDNNVAYGG